MIVHGHTFALPVAQLLDRKVRAAICVAGGSLLPQWLLMLVYLQPEGSKRPQSLSPQKLTHCVTA